MAGLGLLLTGDAHGLHQLVHVQSGHLLDLRELLEPGDLAQQAGWAPSCSIICFIVANLLISSLTSFSLRPEPAGHAARRAMR